MESKACLRQTRNVVARMQWFAYQYLRWWGVREGGRWEGKDVSSVLQCNANWLSGSVVCLHQKCCGYCFCQLG